MTIDQEPFLAVRCMATNLVNGYVIETHVHTWHQLLCARSGAMTVYGGNWSWIAPPGTAVLIPAGTSHSIRMWGDVAARSLYFAPWVETPALKLNECRVFSVTPLLREMILRVIDLGALDTRLPRHEALLSVLLDELNIEPDQKLGVPLPSDARALALASHILASPASDETLDQLSRRFGASRRTLERLFQMETGLSLGLWRQKVRMLHSVRILAEGQSVTTAALDTGYASVSAFIAAFRKTFGYTPGRFDEGPRLRIPTAS